MLFRWDLDRTYLDTDIHSVRGLLRAATEPALAKRALPGAQALAIGLQRGTPAARTRFISGSPEQLRNTLSQKLRSDGVEVDRLVLKDNLGNLRRGRFAAIRSQLSYKLPVLVCERAEGRPCTELLFGDDSEADPAIYALYAALVDGRAGEETLREALRADGATPESVDATARAFEAWRPGPPVDSAWIRLDNASAIRRFDGLGPVIRPVFAWAQAVPVLFRDRRILASDAGAVWEHTVRCLGSAALIGLLQDAVRRRIAVPEEVNAVFDADPTLVTLRSAVERAIAALGALSALPEPSAFDSSAVHEWLRTRRPRAAVASRPGDG